MFEGYQDKKDGFEVCKDTGRLIANIKGFIYVLDYNSEDNREVVVYDLQHELSICKFQIFREYDKENIQSNFSKDAMEIFNISRDSSKDIWECYKMALVNVEKLSLEQIINSIGD